MKEGRNTYMKVFVTGATGVLGRPEGYMPLIWVDDAANAIVAALERGDSGIYDIVDDNPLRRAEITAAIAAAVGRKRLHSLPAWLMRLVGGPGIDALSRGQRVSNSRFKVATGWTPSVADARTGMPLLVQPDAARAREIASRDTSEHLAARK